MFLKAELDNFYRYCIALTGGDEDEAFDLLHASLEKLLRYPGRQEISNLKAYFMKIIRNQFLDDCRKNGTSKTEEFFEDRMTLSLDGKSLEDLVVNNQHIQKILGSLSPAEREIVYLFAVEEFTAQEIAEYLECPRGTILSRIFRIRVKIKNRFPQETARRKSL